MPKPAGGSQRYVPGLDGLRALAVLAVIAYHVGLSWAPGGLLGVGVFFTLSGYLITDLLLSHQQATGSLGMLEFWRRRARRLLPALFVMLAIVAGWVALLQRAQLPALRGAMAAAAGYVSNWWLIAQNSSYFARFGPPSPLGHLWSLAVEEQFYLVWPWLLLLALRCTAGRPERSRRHLLTAGAAALTVASALAMAVLYHPGYDPTRVYDGTDTRAFALLIGAGLAFASPSRAMAAEVTVRRRRLLEGTGFAGLVIVGLLIWRTTQYSPFLYRGGLVLLSVATAAVVWAVSSPASTVGRVLGAQPLRWLGVRSYGIYLWHYPIIVLTTPGTGAPGLARATVQVAASIAAAALSWRFIEEPIRRGAIGRWRAQLRSGGTLPAAARRGWITAAMSGYVAVFACVALAGGIPAASAGQDRRSDTGQRGRDPGDERPGHQHDHRQPGDLRYRRGPARCAAHVVPVGGAHRRLHLRRLVSADYLPDARLRIPAQYARVGVTRSIMEVSGGRSIVETLLGQPNAYTVAQRLIRHGYRGCWVLALGTNDAADVAVGSNVSNAMRIQRMMALIGTQPVLWVNVKSLLASGPYSERDMRGWDQALLQACPRYPNMRVFNWAAFARPPWFIPDGIHYTSAGYAVRSRLIAGALAAAYPRAPSRSAGQPRVGPVQSCLVG